MKYFEAHNVNYYKDITGKAPEILLVDGNRTGGKTTGFSQMLVEEFLQEGKKFFLLYRYKNEIQNVSEAFFKDIQGLFFQGHDMTHKAKAKGTYYELYLDGNSCGYASSLTMSSKLKKYSHIFSDVNSIFFDEYQDENNLYIPDEVQKFISIHTTIARGKGQAVRFVPVYMCSNSISIFNPYYEALGITTRLNSKTKVLKGNGFVLLRLIIKDVANAQKESVFNQAFSNNNYLSSAIDNSFLNDSNYNVEKKDVRNHYPLFIFRSKGKYFTAYQSRMEGIHIKPEADQTFSVRFGVDQTDRGEGYNNIKNTRYYTMMKYYYSESLISFENQETKRAFLDLI